MLSNGHILSANSQAGVMVTENPASPLYHAAWRSQDGTIKDAGGKILGDVLLLEEVDPDGDVIWFYQVWWYKGARGDYRVIGGIGKWVGIAGERKTRGMICRRADDHFMLNWEAHWKIGE